MRNKFLEILPMNVYKDDKIFVFPQIPDKKINGINKKYTPNLNKNDIIFIIDDTVFGSATEGLTLTDTKIYIHESFTEPLEINIDEINIIKYNGSKLYINGNKVFKSNMPSKKNIIDLYEALINAINYIKEKKISNSNENQNIENNENTNHKENYL